MEEKQTALPTLSGNNALKVLALGDSYTCGEGVAEEHSWPFILCSMIRSFQACEDPNVIAQTGWTTDELWEAIQIKKMKDLYDYVFLLIGVNNQYRRYDISQFTRELEQLIQYALEKANGNEKQVGILSIPDYSVTPFGQQRHAKRTHFELRLYNTLKRDLAHSYSVNWINITQVSLLAHQQALLLCEDRLHPSQWMYQMWAREIWEKMIFTDERKT